MQNVLTLSSMLVLLSAGLALARPAIANQSQDTESGGEAPAALVSQQISGSDYIRDRNGAIIGHFDAAGYVYNHNNRIIAQHDISGYLLNVDGTLLLRDRTSREEVIRLLFPAL